MNLRLRRIGLGLAAGLIYCGIASAQAGADMNQYKRAVAEKISTTAKAKPTKAGVRDISVVGYTLDASGQVTESWIVRAAGEKAMDERALAMFNKSLPLPTPPAAWFASEKQVSLSEAFVFTTDGQFRLQSLIK